MTAKGDKANKETGQHTKITGKDPGPGSAADTKVKLAFQQHKEVSDRTPYQPHDPSKG